MQQQQDDQALLSSTQIFAIAMEMAANGNELRRSKGVKDAVDRARNKIEEAAKVRCLP